GGGGPGEGVRVGDAVARERPPQELDGARLVGDAIERDEALGRPALRRHGRSPRRSRTPRPRPRRAGGPRGRAARAWAPPGGSRGSRGARAGETPAPRARSGRGGAPGCAAIPPRDRDRRAAW